ncbi:hypothetical protein SAMN04489726_7992 [Allokutzneria albata]|uniref:HNH endonuclease n=1 Tax=Allokutzneria albata TaxID=211114 RepID=A0A1H0DTQ3_ALLAB|nr:hypothetical protein SAMN04489726_7992 [Allokutzneria albata]
MVLRPCLGTRARMCTRLTEGVRCPDCARQYEAQRTRAKRAMRPYTHAEQQRRAAAVAAHRAQHGEWCPGWGPRRAHVVQLPNILTADHVVPVGAGGDEGGRLVVRCRVCNSAKAARTLG